MNTQDFTKTIVVDQTPEQAFNAINNVRGWWSENVEGSTDKLNSEFDYHYQDIHLCKLKIVELIPGQRVAWSVLDNYFKFTKDKKEWTGTKIVFDITKKGGKTEIRFTHQGLVPSYECYTICHDAWSHYITSLQNLVATGKGDPTRREQASEFNDRLQN